MDLSSDEKTRRQQEWRDKPYFDMKSREDNQNIFGTRAWRDSLAIRDELNKYAGR